RRSTPACTSSHARNLVSIPQRGYRQGDKHRASQWRFRAASHGLLSRPGWYRQDALGLLAGWKGGRFLGLPDPRARALLRQYRCPAGLSQGDTTVILGAVALSLLFHLSPATSPCLAQQDKQVELSESELAALKKQRDLADAFMRQACQQAL